jgi:D-alanyl-D-alanine carboxypeptidase/D-alanyl-D-alanine-endopeptidase (penicillin-binding protein 4)
MWRRACSRVSPIPMNMRVSVTSRRAGRPVIALFVGLATLLAPRLVLAQGDGDGGVRRPASAGGSGSRKAGGGARALRFTTPVGESALTSDLNAMLQAKVRSGNWGAMVVSLTRGDTLFNFDAGRSVLPASTMKLFTSALAFERLGPSYRFKTDVLRQGTLSPDGTLQGNLVIRGGGDPAFSSRFIPGGSPNAPMHALAQQVAQTGIRRVHGDVVGDDHAFEAKPVPDGWLTRYLQSSYAARVSALSLNENLLDVVVAAGNGSVPVVTLEPGTTAYKVVNATRTVAGSRGAKLTVGRMGNGAIAVRGWIGSRSEPRVYVVVVDDPATFATGALARALGEAGIPVDGSVRLGQTPNDAIPVTSMSSPPLAEIAGVMNRESINHFAELIFRNVARTADPSGVGSAAMGNAVLKDFLMLRVGSRADDVFAADGSGLSTLDRVTARSEVQLLSYADRAPWSREFHESLPMAGREETLRQRMRGTPAQGNLHAKTGTTNDVIALSGYVWARDGEVLAFSFIYNGKDRWNARETIDAMGATLAGFSR